MEYDLKENVSMLHRVPAIDWVNHLGQLSQQLGFHFLTYKMEFSMKIFKISEIIYECSEGPLLQTVIVHYFIIDGQKEK